MSFAVMSFYKYISKRLYGQSFILCIQIVAEGQGNTVGLIVFVYSDQISTKISNKNR